MRWGCFVACAAAAALSAACEPLPQPYPRIVAAGPSGTVAPGEIRVEFTGSEPFARDDVLLGHRLALCRAEDLREVRRYAEAGEPQPAGGFVEATPRLEDGGRRAVLVPEEPLVPGLSYAAVLAHGVRAADGRLVLDPEGKPRSVVVEFTVSGEVAKSVRAEIVKVLADADAPEAGGEYVEVANLGPEPLDLAGFRLAKRGPSGSFTRCTMARRGGTPIPPGSRGLVVGGAWDDRYSVPSGAAVYTCGASAVAGGLANSRAPALLLEAPNGAPLSSIGVAAEAPHCPGEALVRVDAAGPDAAENLACTEVLPPSVARGAAPHEGG